MTVPVIILEGGPEARGRAHGCALRAAIHHNVAWYLARFTSGRTSREDVMAAGLAWADRIGQDDPVYAVEMKALAEAADIPLALIAMLNARYELSYVQTTTGEPFGMAAPGPGHAEVDGCTTIGVEAEVTRDGRTLLAQTWDWHDALLGRTAVLHCLPDDGPRSVAFTEAGIVGGKIGLNDRGIGLVVNGLCTDRDGLGPMHTAFHLRCRRILAADRFDEALRPIVETPHMTSANYLVAQAGGEMIDIEADPERYSVIYPEDGLLTHANHFEGGHPGSRLERQGPHSLFRARRLRRLVQRQAGAIDPQFLKSALADHYSHPASICRHIDPRRGQAYRLMTVAAVVLDLDAAILHVTGGPPCSTPWQEVPLD